MGGTDCGAQQGQGYGHPEAVLQEQMVSDHFRIMASCGRLIQVSIVQIGMLFLGTVAQHLPLIVYFLGFLSLVSYF